jgi:hypothetical protein
MKKENLGQGLLRNVNVVGEIIKVNAEGTIKEGIKWMNVALESRRRALVNALMKLFNGVWGILEDLKLSLSTV